MIDRLPTTTGRRPKAEGQILNGPATKKR